MSNSLQSCIESFRQARVSIVEAIEKLYRVYKDEAWRDGDYGSFSEFCESELKISRSLGSQYVQVYDYYIEQGGLAAKQLREVDATKLYLLIGAKGTAEKKMAMAQTLTRGEIKQNKAEKDGKECQHIHKGEICFDCNVRLG